MKSARINPFFVFLFVLVVLNLLILDFWIFTKFRQDTNVLGTSDTSCPQSCLREIQRNSGSSAGVVRELFVPLGNGTAYNTDWTDVPGVYASINRENYNRIKSVVFEVTLSIPASSQVVWIRLYNATDKHPVWYSEVTTSESGPKTLVSSPISLDSGLKEYQVQLKTQLGGIVNITNSRIRINTY
jgi:hypothetical protein